MLVRRATAADVPQMAAALADAFSGDPPMQWHLPDPADRPALLRRYFGRTLARLYMRVGEVWMCEQPLGAAVWIPPGAWPPRTRDELAVVGVSLRVFGRHPIRSLTGQSEIRRGHPRAPHWYLEFIGVDPRAHGRGAGSALLRPVLDRCDADGVPAYLNAGSPQSRDLYRRHGFEVTERFTLPFDGPPLWRMWREPR